MTTPDPCLPLWQANQLGELLAAIGDAELSAEEMRSLTWLAGWEAHTIRHLTAVIARVRSEANPAVAAMRSWLADCSWADVDSAQIQAMPDVQILRAVDRHWDGGLTDFLRTVEEDPR